jgi:ribosomal-protein-alanine N-acetyltransferase
MDDAADAGVRTDVDLPFVTRPMLEDDLDEVLVIERASFPNPWPASAFRHDLQRTDYATYLVATPRRPPAVVADPAPSSRWTRFFSARPPARCAGILGYVGMWQLVDEAHICNIAVAPAARGRGVGELLLLRVIQAGGERGMATATLEVRVSNHVAQNLYVKFGFEVVGRRRRYYSDNGEDALIMSTGLITSPEYRYTLRKLEETLVERMRAAG